MRLIFRTTEKIYSPTHARTRARTEPKTHPNPNPSQQLFRPQASLAGSLCGIREHSGTRTRDTFATNLAPPTFPAVR